jgi:Glycosyltransferases, probably involved in cell wall biogenesis
MENGKLVSIIVPVYNVEQYLRKCLETIISQTYQNLEIILINDGATDSSPVICREYAGKDSRIVLINQENGGLSRARNTGVRASHGEYIGFVDSDDFIYFDMYEKLVSTLEMRDADIAECLVEDVNQDKETGVRDEENGYYEMTGKQALYKLISNEKGVHPRYAVWSKLFKRKLIEDLQFPQGEIHEDYFYDTLAFLRAEKYVILRSKLYCHRNRPCSITSVPFNLKDYDKLKHIDERTKYLLKNGYADLAEASQKDEYETLLDYYDRAFKADMPWECEKIKNILWEKKEYIHKCGFKNLRRIEFRLFYINAKLYIAYKKIKDKLYVRVSKGS